MGSATATSVIWVGHESRKVKKIHLRHLPRSRRLLMVITQESAQSLAALNGPVAADERALRNLIAREVGVQRNARSLAHALGEIASLEQATPSPALRNLATTALLIVAAAFGRRESRGAQFRRDFPTADPAQARRTMLTLADARAIARHAAQAEPRAVAATWGFGSST
jgi:aspartate oxidase